jgi:hypothetical protein
VQLTVFRTGTEYWLHVQASPVISEEIRAGFRRMDEELELYSKVVDEEIKKGASFQ